MLLLEMDVKTDIRAGKRVCNSIFAKNHADSVNVQLSFEPLVKMPSFSLNVGEKRDLLW